MKTYFEKAQVQVYLYHEVNVTFYYPVTDVIDFLNQANYVEYKSFPATPSAKYGVVSNVQRWYGKVTGFCMEIDFSTPVLKIFIFDRKTFLDRMLKL